MSRLPEERPWLKTPWPLILFLVFTGILCVLFLGNPFERFELQVFDAALHLRSQLGLAPPIDSRIVFVDITAADLKELPDWRDEYRAAAALITEASALGARMMIFDIIYNRGTPDMARPILEAIETSGVPVIFAEALNHSGIASLPAVARNDVSLRARPNPTVAQSQQREIGGREGVADEAISDSHSNLSDSIRSFPFLSPPYKPAGLIHIEPDQDGVYRHYRLFHDGTSGPEPSLALAAYFVLRGISWPEAVSFPSPQAARWQTLSPDGTKRISEEIKLKDPSIVSELFLPLVYQGGGKVGERLDSLRPFLAFPFSPQRRRIRPLADINKGEGFSLTGYPLLDMRSRWESKGPAAFPHLSLSELHELYTKSQPEGRRPLAGKILFVAYAASGVSDFGATSFGKHQPLVQLHATALNDLIQQTFHFRPPRWGDVFVLSTILLFGGIAACARGAGMLILFWISGLMLAAAAGFVILWRTPWVLPLAAWAVLWTLVGAAEFLRRYVLEFVRRLRLHATMSYYFSPKVLAHVLAHPGALEPKQVELTVLMTDLRNFTAISERLGAKKTFELLNRIFEVQTRAVLAFDATLEHFIGDQFMCYWGAPDPQPGAADLSIQAAAALLNEMKNIRQTLEPAIQELFGFGIAVNRGTAMIGNIGSLQRMDYGVVGDLINATARLESLTKYYGVPLILTQETFGHLSRRPSYRLLDRVRPVGKTVPLEIVEIQHAYSSPAFNEIASKYSAAYANYQQGNFEKAHQAFRALAEECEDGPSRLLAKRCQELAEANLKSWTGIYEFKSK